MLRNITARMSPPINGGIYALHRNISQDTIEAQPCFLSFHLYVRAAVALFPL